MSLFSDREYWGILNLGNKLQVSVRVIKHTVQAKCLYTVAEPRFLHWLCTQTMPCIWTIAWQYTQMHHNELEAIKYKFTTCEKAQRAVLQHYTTRSHGDTVCMKITFFLSTSKSPILSLYSFCMSHLSQFKHPLIVLPEKHILYLWWTCFYIWVWGSFQVKIEETVCCQIHVENTSC